MSHVTDMNESCHICMSHVTRMSESCHMWMSYITHVSESCHTYMWCSHHNPTWLLLIWTSHTYESVPWDISMRHLSYMSHFTCLIQMSESHISNSRMKHMNEASFTYQRVMHHTSLCPVQCMCDMTHSYAWNDDAQLNLFTPVTPLIRMCHMTHSYVHASFKCAARLIQTWVASQWHVPWLNQMCSAWLPSIQRFQEQWWQWTMTHYVHHDSYITHDSSCTPWLIHMCYDWFTCGLTHLYITFRFQEPFSLCRDSFIDVPWLIYRCAVTHL